MMLHHYGEVMKFLVLSFFYLISQHSFSDELLKEKNLEIEPKYYLIPKHKYKGKPIVLYSTPDVNGKIVKEVYINENKYWDADTFRKFDDNKKHPFPFLVVASTEKKDSFYKVYFESRYLWVEEGSFKKVYDMKSYFKDMFDVIVVDPKGIKAYKVKGRKRISFEELKKSLPNNYSSDGDWIDFKIINSEYYDEKFWIFGEICKSNPTGYLQGEITCNDTIKFWMRPFQDNGQPNGWSYPYKDVSI